MEHRATLHSKPKVTLVCTYLLFYLSCIRFFFFFISILCLGNLTMEMIGKLMSKGKPGFPKVVHKWCVKSFPLISSPLLLSQDIFLHYHIVSEREKILWSYITYVFLVMTDNFLYSHRT